MNEVAPEVIELQTLMWLNRLKPSVVMRRARLSPSTWTRWASGAQPNVKNVRAVRAAIEAKIAEAEA